MLHTDFIKRRSGDQTSKYYNYEIYGERVPTYIYTPKYQYSVQDDPSVLTDPRYNLLDIGYNYVMEMSQNALNRGLEHEYDKGDIYGYPVVTKAFHNSLYTTDMSGQSDLRNCRQYVGIGLTRGYGSQRRPYLKYYDVVDYSGTVGSTRYSEQIEDVHLSSNSSIHYPYQKIEYYYPSVFSSKSKHKSTLFSVRIDNCDIDSEIEKFETGGELHETAQYPDRVVGLLKKIKSDIKAGVREIVKNVAPANTQLFDVYFN